MPVLEPRASRAVPIAEGPRATVVTAVARVVVVRRARARAESQRQLAFQRWIVVVLVFQHQLTTALQ